MRRILILAAVWALSAGCCVRLDVPFVPFIADPQLLAAPSAAPLTDGDSVVQQEPRSLCAAAPAFPGHSSVRDGVRSAP